MTNNERSAHEADTTSPARTSPGRTSPAQTNPGRPGPATRVSRLSVSALAVALLIGLAKGAVAYSHRSPVPARHVGGTNAITVHLVLAIAAAAGVIVIQVHRSGKRSRPAASPWIAPFSSRAATRMGQAFRLAPRAVAPRAVAARAVPTVLLTLVLLYCPYRMGAQIIGGLDPNATVNAWGGPTYAGALLAHGLDCAVLFYAAAFLLGRLLPPLTAGDQGASRVDPASPSADEPDAPALARRDLARPGPGTGC